MSPLWSDMAIARAAWDAAADRGLVDPDEKREPAEQPKQRNDWLNRARRTVARRPIRRRQTSYAL